MTAGSSRWPRSAILLLIAGVAARIVWLSSDAYLHLDWSAGLLTDEGFYIHNARNWVLFGMARTDEFNNMLLAPVLHVLQCLVFMTLGVGAIQARLISVVLGLLGAASLYGGLRRIADERIAITALVFALFDHPALLFGRMALMDTPAAFCICWAFYSYCRAVTSGVEDAKSRRNWLALSGFALSLGITNRMLCIYLLPVFVFAVYRMCADKQARDQRSPVQVRQE